MTWQQPVPDPALPPGIPIPAHIRARAGAPAQGQAPADHNNAAKPPNGPARQPAREKTRRVRAAKNPAS